MHSLFFKQGPSNETGTCICIHQPTHHPSMHTFCATKCNSCALVYSITFYWVQWGSPSIFVHTSHLFAFLPQNKYFGVDIAANIATVFLRLTVGECSTCRGLRHLLESVVLHWHFFVYLRVLAIGFESYILCACFSLMPCTYIVRCVLARCPQLVFFVFAENKWTIRPIWLVESLEKVLLVTAVVEVGLAQRELWQKGQVMSLSFSIALSLLLQSWTSSPYKKFYCGESLLYVWERCSFCC